MPTAIFSPFLILLQVCVAFALTTFEKEEEKEKPLGSFLIMVAFPRVFSDDITSFHKPLLCNHFWRNTERQERASPATRIVDMQGEALESGRGLQWLWRREEAREGQIHKMLMRGNQQIWVCCPDTWGTRQQKGRAVALGSRTLFYSLFLSRGILMKPLGVAATPVPHCSLSPYPSEVGW